MKAKTIQNRFTTKQHQLEYACKYGLSHFCDGKPNKSVDEYAKPKPPCPKYYFCNIRKISIYDEGDSFDD